MIDLSPTQISTVKSILEEHVPDCEVRAFGSRVTWTAQKHSDLDLAIIGETPLDPALLGHLKDAFEHSDLPIRVDILDWHTISDAFRKMIQQRYELIQRGMSANVGR